MNENDQAVTTAVSEAFRGSSRSGTLAGGEIPTGTIVDPGNPAKWENMGRTVIEKGVPVAVNTAAASTALIPKVSLPVRLGLFALGLTADREAVAEVIVKAILDTNSDDAPEAETEKKKKKEKKK